MAYSKCIAIIMLRQRNVDLKGLRVKPVVPERRSKRSASRSSRSVNRRCGSRLARARRASSLPAPSWQVLLQRSLLAVIRFHLRKRRRAPIHTSGSKRRSSIFLPGASNISLVGEAIRTVHDWEARRAELLSPPRPGPRQARSLACRGG